MNEQNPGKEIALTIFPFENLTDGRDLDVFCRSFQIELITELSRFRQFNIIAHDSKSAHIDYTIKGSFHHHDEQIRINAQLIDNADNRIVWADRFEGTLASIFSIQEGLLTQIVSRLQHQLNYDLLSRMRKKPAPNLSAYEYWLYGMEELKKGTPEADEKARTYFQKVIEIDPNYSLAYSGMSMTYFNEWSCQLWDRWDVCQFGAYEWAKKAIGLDEQNYVAACVLGRIYLYEAQYELAEHYLRKALHLNSNDTDNLIQIASCFVFLGHAAEAKELYNRVLRINPHHSNSYHHIAALIAFELGDFHTCLALGANATTPWVDFAAIMAAACFETNDHEGMHRHWNTFMNDFRKRIAGSNDADEVQAVQWIMNVNPYRGKTNLLRFWNFIGGKQVSLSERTFERTASRDQENYLCKENDRWHICFEGDSVYLTEVKGFYDLSSLLLNPEKQFHCMELAGGGVVSDTDPIFDQKAKRQYQTKILELQEEINWSEQNNDLARTVTLQKEYDQIVDHLSSALGLGGKTRKAGDPLDKVRSAVTWRIRSAIRKISRENPALGKHLSVSVRTGLFCSYNPDRPIRWRTGRDSQGLTS